MNLGTPHPNNTESIAHPKCHKQEMGFDMVLTEAAQIEDTSLQISDMKIPQDVKKLE